MNPIKIRVLKSKVLSAADAAGLDTALADWLDEMRQTDAELVSIIYVADFTVLVTYTGA